MNKIKEVHQEQLLLLKDKILNLKSLYSNINFLITLMIEDIEKIEHIIIQADINSNWSIVGSMIEELNINLSIIENLLDENIRNNIPIFSNPINKSSEILYILIYNTNILIQNEKIIPATIKLKRTL